MKKLLLLICILFVAFALLIVFAKNSALKKSTSDTTKQVVVNKAETINVYRDTTKIDSIISFAKTLIGIPYQYASIDPAIGFDCSGFITYVFSHFKIPVPRSSVEFTNIGTEIPVSAAAKGDLILFTGTDSSEKTVGHMGIVIDNSDSLRFIHSSSGKANGVNHYSTQ